MKRRQLRVADYTLHDSVMQKVWALNEALESGRIPRRKIYNALIAAMAQAFRHGVSHGVNMMRGKADRATVILLVLLFNLSAICSAQMPEEPLAWDASHRSLAEGIGRAALAGQAIGTTVVAIKAWREGHHAPAWRATCATLVTIAASEGLKALVHQTRPDGSDNKAFPSEDSALGAAWSGWKLEFGIPIGAWIGLSRAAADRHYFKKNVLPGWGIGALAQAGCSAVIR